MIKDFTFECRLLGLIAMTNLTVTVHTGMWQVDFNLGLMCLKCVDLQCVLMPCKPLVVYVNYRRVQRCNKGLM
jgi:hypothetical protein